MLAIEEINVAIVQAKDDRTCLTAPVWEYWGRQNCGVFWGLVTCCGTEDRRTPEQFPDV